MLSSRHSDFARIEGKKDCLDKKIGSALETDLRRQSKFKPNKKSDRSKGTKRTKGMFNQMTVLLYYLLSVTPNHGRVFSQLRKGWQINGIKNTETLSLSQRLSEWLRTSSIFLCASASFVSHAFFHQTFPWLLCNSSSYCVSHCIVRWWSWHFYISCFLSNKSIIQIHYSLFLSSHDWKKYTRKQLSIFSEDDGTTKDSLSPLRGRHNNYKLQDE